VNNKFIIYKITNKINNRVYIGQTINFKERMNSYKKEIRNKNIQRPIILAMRKHGFKNFDIEIIDNSAINIEELNDLEIYYIEKENSMIDQNGYNIQTGGRDGFYDHSVRMKKDNLRIICLNDGNIFDNAFEVVDFYKVKFPSVLDTCAGRSIFTKEEKTFRYIDKYDTIQDDFEFELNRNQYELIDDNFKHLFIPIVENKVLDIMTGNVYKNIEELASEFNEKTIFNIKNSLNDNLYSSKTYSGHIFFYLDKNNDIIQKSNNEVDYYIYEKVLPKYRYLVKCKEKDLMYLDIVNNKTYYTTNEISEKENIPKYSIESQIRGERKSFDDNIFLQTHNGNIVPPKNKIITSKKLYDKVDDKYKVYLDIDKGIHQSSKKVIDLMTGVKYNSISEVANKLGVNGINISKCCRGLNKTCCNHVFRHLDENNNIIPSDMNVIVNKKIYEKILPEYRYLVDIGKGKQPRQVRLIDITTGKTYERIKDASIELNIDDTSITKCIQGKQCIVKGRIFLKLDENDNIINTNSKKIVNNIEYEKILPEYRHLVDKIEELDTDSKTFKSITKKQNRIIEITTGKAFDSYSKASVFFNISSESIAKCSKGFSNTTHDLIFFMCDEKYNIFKNSKVRKIDIDIYNKVLPKYKEFVKIDENIMKIIDITTGTIYNNTSDIKNKLNIDNGKVLRVINGVITYTDKNRIFRKINYKGEIQNIYPIKEVSQSIYNNILPEYRHLVKLKS